MDDNLDQVTSLSLMLDGMGYEVRSAINGFSALASTRNFRPDVVLLDIGLPDTDGVEVARVLRREDPRKSLRIFALTGRSGAEDRQRALSAGIDKYLVKPVVPSHLESLLDEPADRGELPPPV